MSSLLNDFVICAKIPENIKITVKLFYIFDKNLIFVTNEEKVYGLGQNNRGSLGFGHNNDVQECTEIKELSKQKIIDFFSGESHVLGRNEENTLLGWGVNDKGQLGRGYTSKDNEYLKPDKIELSTDEKLKDFCCGFDHSLVLLSNGLIYGWGSNREGQLGLANKPYINKPIKLRINSRDELKFKSIYCYRYSSFAITENGLVYSWGHNGRGILGQATNQEICAPAKIDLFDVIQIGSNINCTYFLTNEGTIYFCGEYHANSKTLDKLEVEKTSKYTLLVGDCGTHNYQYCFDSDEEYYYFEGNKLLRIEDNFDTIYDFYARRMSITPRTVQITDVNAMEYSYLKSITENFEHVNISNSLKSMKTSWQSNQNSSETNLKYSNIRNEFEEISDLGTGSFGQVKKFKNIVDNQFYAIKMIVTPNPMNLSLEECRREVQIMAELRSHFVVQYNNSWIENNCLFIQMEFCSENLKNILKSKQDAFASNSSQTMNSIEYFISCEILRQITEALNYLHSLKPEPLIHRDLKPDNILIGSHNNKRICKLADFGLSKFINIQPGSHSEVGTPNYMAPEVDSRHYDLKADIFSLGKIASEIFRIYYFRSDSKLCPNIAKWKEFIDSKMIIYPEYQRRFSCNEILEQIKEMSVDFNDIRSVPQFVTYLEKIKEREDFIYFYDILNQNN